jgi:hypothetical protein
MGLTVVLVLYAVLFAGMILTDPADSALRRVGDLRLTCSSEAEAIWRRIVEAIKRLRSHD